MKSCGKIFYSKNLALCAAFLSLALGFTPPASAGVIAGPFVPMITAGAPPDSPGNHVDPNTPASPFSGVVSLNVIYDGKSFICSGTLVSKRDVVTAGHCVDTTGQGQLIDLHKPGSSVRAIFNNDSPFGLISATSVSMNPSYQGFGVCPYATTTDFCLNDDVAVVHLGADAPASAKIYKAYAGDLSSGQLITMAGYGLSGTGDIGYTVGTSFFVKRTGQNIMDVFDNDDETHFSGGKNEVWYADFDGGGYDTFCNLPGVMICTPALANDKESMIGGGDSGGPTFMFDGSDYLLVGNNTFGSNFGSGGPPAGAFGNYFGGMMINAYIDYLESATGGQLQLVPEPATIPLVLAGLGMLGAMTRRRKAG